MDGATLHLPRLTVGCIEHDSEAMFAANKRDGHHLGTIARVRFRFSARHGMATTREQPVQRGYHYAIGRGSRFHPDRMTARTPVIISGPATISTINTTMETADRAVGADQTCLQPRIERAIEKFEPGRVEIGRSSHVSGETGSPSHSSFSHDGRP